MRIRHLTRVEYDGEARSSYNEVRMTPLDDGVQTTLASRIMVRPPVPVWTYRDYWGTTVSVFDLAPPHAGLTVEAISRVETSGPRPLPAPPTWSQLTGMLTGTVSGTVTRTDGALGELLRPTPMTTITDEVAGIGRAQTGGRDPHEAAAAIAAAVAGRVAYVPGSTGVQTSAQEAWEQGQGVCQDMAHLTVALLRAAGLPARYVSGYLHPATDAKIGEPVDGQSHAWVEYWAGDWVPLDPTNRLPVGEGHVVVARGRDYSDVPPLKGIYQGPGGGRQEVRVTVTRLA
ncbi:transglutaminase-like putative cysteine protease [Thermocatellispora tengchongensis]|uniref:Transglutaminase-like putative cysteine protease n=1 Tax=Thermocatellispora tengchongensis TaxID=1073253 RepID=A0A840PB91_9ACTN|nr:transglutaminase family protein [Thermocatellispora tengchongensis]MBB5136512.1 transglutaminase-like putative cysteine protease [Thermocatellispora tengchongensis]